MNVPVVLYIIRQLLCLAFAHTAQLPEQAFVNVRARRHANTFKPGITITACALHHDICAVHSSCHCGTPPTPTAHQLYMHTSIESIYAHANPNAAPSIQLTHSLAILQSSTSTCSKTTQQLISPPVILPPAAYPSPSQGVEAASNRLVFQCAGLIANASAAEIAATQAVIEQATAAAVGRRQPPQTPAAAPQAFPPTLVGGTPDPTGLSAADAFSLHSRPGARLKLVLDFDGNTLVGGVWNQAKGLQQIVTPAYDKGGWGAGCSAAALQCKRHALAHQRLLIVCISMQASHCCWATNTACRTCASRVAAAAAMLFRAFLCRRQPKLIQCRRDCRHSGHMARSGRR